MAISWIDRIRQKKQLAVYASALGGTWTTLFPQALREFNALAHRYGLGVTLTASRVTPANSGGADVAVSTASGAVSASYGGTQESGSFDGNRMHGLTLLFSRDDSLEKAFIFLPIRPQVNTPQGVRAVGASVMTLIAVHELVHACGLENSDHSADDLFQANPQVDPGSQPGGDRVIINLRGKMSFMPPLVLSSLTVGRLKSLWS